jgi:hypothetical protein
MMDNLLTAFKSASIDIFFTRSINAGGLTGATLFPGMANGLFVNNDPGIVVAAFTNTTGVGPRRTNAELGRTLAHEFLHYAMKSGDRSHADATPWRLFASGGTGSQFKRDVTNKEVLTIDAGKLTPSAPDQ